MNIVKATPPCWFYLLLIVWAIFALGLYVIDTHAQEDELISVYCESFSSEIGSREFIQFFQQLKGRDAWLGYPPQGEEARVGVENLEWGTKYGFLNDTSPWNKTTLLYRKALSGRGTMGGIQMMIDPDHPQDVYLFVYGDITPKTDAYGEHLGNHPCGAFIITPEDALRLLVYSKDK